MAKESEPVTVRINAELLKKIDELAESTCTNRSVLLNQMAMFYFLTHEKDNKGFCLVGKAPKKRKHTKKGEK